MEYLKLRFLELDLYISGREGWGMTVARREERERFAIRRGLMKLDR